MFSQYQDKNSLKRLQKNCNWRLLKFSDVLRDDTKNAKKIKKEEYSIKGSYPIIDQGKSYIAGFTNDKEGIYDKYPLIIFGDHTRILKYIDFPMFIGADGVKLLKNVFSEEEVLTKYIYYYLRTVNIPDTGYNRHFKFLKEVVIPVPSIDLQKRIVFILDKAQELIDKRKAQIEALDELAQSVFLEMFGDPYRNERNWSKVILGDVFEFIKRGKTPKYTEHSSLKVINQKCIYWNIFKEENCKFYSEQFIHELSDDDFIKNGDILLNSTGTGTLGRALVMTDVNNHCYIADSHVTIARPNIHLLNPVYFAELVKNQNIQKQIYKECVNGSTNQIELSCAKLSKLKVILPSIKKQNKFAEIITKIKYQREFFKQGLIELETNFHSLMHRAFKGELFHD